jgi:hypothetical protein
MTNDQAREVFNEVIKNQVDGNTIAKLELCREYFTNGDFRSRLEEYLWSEVSRHDSLACVPRQEFLIYSKDGE